MVLQQLNAAEQVKRLRVEMEAQETGKQAKIRLESYDEHLGWYTAGSLSLPLHQLAMLEQAIADMRACESDRQFSGEKIIPFPGVMTNATG
jgi:hypothetical protein